MLFLPKIEFIRYLEEMYKFPVEAKSQRPLQIILHLADYSKRLERNAELKKIAKIYFKFPDLLYIFISLLSL